MNRLEIVGFENYVDKLVSNRFKCIGIESSDEMYRLMLISSKNNTEYQIGINRVIRPNGDYQIWMWDSRTDVSYPMTIHKSNLNSMVHFIDYLYRVTEIADDGGFTGQRGNETIK